MQGYILNISPVLNNKLLEVTGKLFCEDISTTRTRRLEEEIILHLGLRLNNQLSFSIWPKSKDIT